MLGASQVTFVDQFCGCGGSSQGARSAGAQLTHAVNHWQLAVDSHQANFPGAPHFCLDVTKIGFFDVPKADLLITSPECTNHSIAKGKKRADGQGNFWDGERDAGAERSRMTMYEVVRWAESARYKVVIVENVVDAGKWALFQNWLEAMHVLGYQHKVLFLNSMFFPPTPQSRDRMYTVFWQKGHPSPDLEFRPPALCAECSGIVEAVQAWKNPAIRWGRYGKQGQYVYVCPKCTKEVFPQYTPAFVAINWSLPIERIGDRKRQLNDSTLARIVKGLHKFAGRPWPYVTDLGFGGRNGASCYPVDNSTPTQTTAQSMGLTIPPFISQSKSVYGSDHAADEPFPTQTTQQSDTLIVPPFLHGYYTRDAETPIDEPVPTQSTQPRHYVVTPPFIFGNYSNATATGLNEPHPTVMTNQHHSLIVPPGHENDLVMSYYNNPGYRAMWQAISTVTALARHSLLSPGNLPDVEDCGFRMIRSGEVIKIMGFENDYKVLGSERQRVEQAGNAVTPPVMDWITSRCIATFHQKG
jgi:DNA (cytosine-5)-methyltransferase 1